jgi:[protein-PII] uridylyltransferase
LRAGNSLGLLHRVTVALESCGLDVRSARISTQGSAVVDAFYVVDAAGRLVTDPDRRARVEAALVSAAGEGD